MLAQEVRNRVAKSWVPDPAVRRVRGVLDLDPVFAATGAIGAIEALRDNVAGDTE
jgi:hypothetical protein